MKLIFKKQGEVSFVTKIKSTHVLQLLVGLIIYFALINTGIYIQQGILFTPREWLFNPIYNLILPNPFAWLFLVLCLLAGWSLFEIRKD
jgi:hypothetical protein